jgi:type IV pilus assembly protein PilW
MKLRLIKQAGFSLIELMIAITLGILVVGATLGIFMSNRQTYMAADNLGRVQENARTAYELMTRDIREAGGNSCSKSILIANVLNSPGANWWSNWNTPVTGYDNGALAGSIAGTDAIEVKSGSAAVYTILSHASPVFTLTAATTDIADGDILMACDYRQAAIFQATTGTTGATVNHAASGTPGNCGVGLGFRNPMTCTTAYSFSPNSLITKLSATRWFIASNGRPAGCTAATTCGRSLFRRVVRGNAAVDEEVAEGVRNMQILYLLPGVGSYVDASLVPATRWKDVIAVRMTYTLEGNDSIGTDGQKISRTMDTTVILRNRNS